MSWLKTQLSHSVCRKSNDPSPVAAPRRKSKTMNDGTLRQDGSIGRKNIMNQGRASESRATSGSPPQPLPVPRVRKESSGDGTPQIERREMRTNSTDNHISLQPPQPRPRTRTADTQKPSANATHAHGPPSVPRVATAKNNNVPPVSLSTPNTSSHPLVSPKALQRKGTPLHPLVSPRPLSTVYPPQAQHQSLPKMPPLPSDSPLPSPSLSPSRKPRPLPPSSMPNPPTPTLARRSAADEESPGLYFELNPDGSDLPLFPVEGSLLSASVLDVTDDAAVAKVVGPNRMSFSVVSIIVEGKTQWYVVRCSVISPSNTVVGSWVVPRTFSAFQSLAKSLSSLNVPLELPSKATMQKKKGLGSSEKVMALNSYTMELCRDYPDLMQSCLVMLRFGDPFEKPSALGLRLLKPTDEGFMDMILGGAKGKPTSYYFVLKEHLYFFKTKQDETCAGFVSLNFVTIELVKEPGFPKFCFSITSYNKDATYFALETSKALSEWILKIRKVKFARSEASATGPLAASSPDLTEHSELTLRQNGRQKVHQLITNALTDLSHYPLKLEEIVTGEKALNPEGWDMSSPDDNENIVYSSSSQGPANDDVFVKEASVQKLVEKLFDEKVSNVKYVEVFLMSFRSWLSPESLFAYLLRAFGESTSAMESMGATETVPMQVRLFLVLKIWIRTHFYDFASNQTLAERMLSLLSELSFEGMFENYVAVLKSHIQEKVGLIQPGGGSMVPPPESIVPSIFSKDHIEIIDLHPLEVARQLTLLEFDLFTAIEMSELMGLRWNTPEKEVVSPNVMKMIRRFNQTSLWVQTILLRIENKQHRVSLLQRLIEVCSHLLELNNFNGVMEISSGLRNSNVRRLSETWDLIPAETKSTWSSLQDVLDTSSNFKKYRAKLSETTGPSIPHLGLMLTDLTFSEEGMATKTGTKINFGKACVVGSILLDINKRQSLRYNLKPLEYIINYLQRQDVLDEDTLYKLSLQIEPRK